MTNDNQAKPMEDQDRHTIIQQQTNNNCQQFFGAVSGCVFAMPGSKVTQTPSAASESSSTPSPSSSEPYLDQASFFKYIHPSVSTDADKFQITREIQNLVSSFPLPEICHYLMEMKKANRIYLNVKPELAFAELHRLGMPDGQTEGFSYKNFTKYYNVN